MSTKTCPSGTTLQVNGLCGTGNTYTTTGPTYCGPQYSGKTCTYMAQLTPGITVATGTESGPNMICAFQEGDAQFPCDPGCCGPPPTGETDADTGGEAGTETGSTEPGFPLWAIILLIVLGSLILALFLAWAAKKMSRKSSNGSTKG